jgi:hypothetical protein
MGWRAPRPRPHAGPGPQPQRSDRAPWRYPRAAFAKPRPRPARAPPRRGHRGVCGCVWDPARHRFPMGSGPGATSSLPRGAMCHDVDPPISNAHGPNPPAPPMHAGALPQARSTSGDVDSALAAADRLLAGFGGATHGSASVQSSLEEAGFVCDESGCVLVLPQPQSQKDGALLGGAGGPGAGALCAAGPSPRPRARRPRPRPPPPPAPRPLPAGPTLKTLLSGDGWRLGTLRCAPPACPGGFFTAVRRRRAPEASSGRWMEMPLRPRRPTRAPPLPPAAARPRTPRYPRSSAARRGACRCRRVSFLTCCRCSSSSAPRCARWTQRGSGCRQAATGPQAAPRWEGVQEREQGGGTPHAPAQRGAAARFWAAKAGGARLVAAGRAPTRVSPLLFAPRSGSPAASPCSRRTRRASRWDAGQAGQQLHWGSPELAPWWQTGSWAPCRPAAQPLALQGRGGCAQPPRPHWPSPPPPRHRLGHLTESTAATRCRPSRWTSRSRSSGAPCRRRGAPTRLLTCWRPSRRPPALRRPRRAAAARSRRHEAPPRAPRPAAAGRFWTRKHAAAGGGAAGPVERASPLAWAFLVEPPGRPCPRCTPDF